MSGATVEGMEDLLRKLTNLEQLTAVQAGLGAMAVDLVGRVSPYPPPPAGSRYRRGLDKRSETLGRRWYVEADLDGNRVVLGNNASYARFEHDVERQTSQHRQTGWRTYQEEWAKAIPQYNELLRDYTVRAIEQ